jgi:hypothetical protein
VLDGVLSDRSDTSCPDCLLEDYLFDSIQCYSLVPQGSLLGPIFLILDINLARVFNRFLNRF